MSEPRPHLAIFRDLPTPIAHVSTIEGVRSVWLEIRSLVTSTDVTQGLPKFVIGFVETMIDHDDHRAVEAIRRGDVAFFVGLQMRLDQLDCALVAAGRTLGQRAPVVRAKYMLSGFVDVAVENLQRLGGSWPPTPQPFTADAAPPAAAATRSARRSRASREPPATR